jgi:lysyl-tRNA synthetase class 2
MTEITTKQDQHEVRVEKLNKWREHCSAYPNQIKNTACAQDLCIKYKDMTKIELEEQRINVQLSGRIMTQRLMGKASFAHIQDGSGEQIQCYFRSQDVGVEQFEFYKTFDLGDIIYVEAYVFKTKTNELSLYVLNFKLLAKSLWPLPDKFHGLQDKEARYRKRYLDLMVNQKSREVFKIRSKVVNAIRDFLTENDFMEVETPMMQALAGGATAKPFITHHNALDMSLFLRIAPELYLKRLIVGGFDKVFELNRNFRNEGISTRHNPEFTMVEFYQAYATYLDLIDFTELLLRYVVNKVYGKLMVEYQGFMLDFSKPFLKIAMADAILFHNESIPKTAINDIEFLQSWCKKNNMNVEQDLCLGMLHVEIFEKTVEKKLIEPTFITEYPAVCSPLARRSDANPELTDRFEFFMCGQEVANGFSELNDPEDQAARFKSQVAAREQGDDEAMLYDSDYVKALEYGMPPTAGEGIGIDRLVMCLTNSTNIRDVILFPLLRQETDS